MQHPAEPGDAGHESAAEFPDMRLSAESLADDGYEFVGRKRLVVAHVVDSRRNVLGEQAADGIAYILHRSEGAQVVESAERPWNSPGHDRIEQIEVATDFPGNAESESSKLRFGRAAAAGAKRPIIYSSALILLSP